MLKYKETTMIKTSTIRKNDVRHVGKVSQNTLGQPGKPYAETFRPMVYICKSDTHSHQICEVGRVSKDTLGIFSDRRTESTYRPNTWNS